MTRPSLPALELLVCCSSPLSAPAQGRDAVDLLLASLALGWRTGALLLGSAREWLAAQSAPTGPMDPFARALASLPIYELEVVHVIDDDARTWRGLPGLPVQVWPACELPRVLASARQVLHP